jgi:hypothetical protein
MNKYDYQMNNPANSRRDLSGYEEAIEVDPDDTPIEEVKSSLRRALQEAKSGQRIPIAQMWKSIDLPSQANG